MTTPMFLSHWSTITDIIASIPMISWQYREQKIVNEYSLNLFTLIILFIYFIPISNQGNNEYEHIQLAPYVVFYVNYNVMESYTWTCTLLGAVVGA